MVEASSGLGDGVELVWRASCQRNIPEETVTSTATAKEPRFPQLTMDQLNDAQRPLGEAIMKISSVGIGGPYNALLRSPVLGQRLFDLFHYLRWETTVPLKLNEFAI